jgi:hypothetical protein
LADALLVGFVDLIDPVLSAAKVHSPVAIAINVLQGQARALDEVPPEIRDALLALAALDALAGTTSSPPEAPARRADTPNHG